MRTQRKRSAARTGRPAQAFHPLPIWLLCFFTVLMVNIVQSSAPVLILTGCRKRKKPLMSRKVQKQCRRNRKQSHPRTKPEACQGTAEKTYRGNIFQLAERPGVAVKNRRLFSASPLKAHPSKFRAGKAGLRGSLLHAQSHKDQDEDNKQAHSFLCRRL